MKWLHRISCCFIAASMIVCEGIAVFADTRSDTLTAPTGGKILVCNDVATVTHYYLKCGHSDPSECFVSSYVATAKRRDVPVLFPQEGDAPPVAGVEISYGNEILPELRSEVASYLNNSSDFISQCILKLDEVKLKALLHDVLAYPEPGAADLGYEVLGMCLDGDWDTGDVQFPITSPSTEESDADKELAAYSPLTGEVLILKVFSGQPYSRPVNDLATLVGAAFLKIRESGIVNGLPTPEFESSAAATYISFPMSQAELQSKVKTRNYPIPLANKNFQIKMYAEALQGTGMAQHYRIKPSCYSSNRDVVGEVFCEKTGLSTSNHSLAWCPHDQYESIRDVVSGVQAFNSLVVVCTECSEILGTEYNEKALKSMSKLRNHLLDVHIPKIVERDLEFDRVRDYMLLGYALNDSNLKGFFALLEAEPDLLGLFIETSVGKTDGGVGAAERQQYLKTDMLSIMGNAAEIQSALMEDGSFFSFSEDKGFSKNGSQELQLTSEDLLDPFVKMWDLYKEYKDAPYTEELDQYLFPSNNKDGLIGILLNTSLGIEKQRPWSTSGARTDIGNKFTLLTSVQAKVENKIDGMNGACKTCGGLGLGKDDIKLGGLFAPRISKQDGLHALAGGLSHIATKHLKTSVNVSTRVVGGGTTLYGMAMEFADKNGSALNFSQMECDIIKQAAQVEYAFENGAAGDTQLHQARFNVFKILKSKGIDALKEIGLDSRDRTEILAMSNDAEQVSAAWLSSHMASLVYRVKGYMATGSILNYNQRMLNTLDAIKYIANTECRIDGCEHRVALKSYADKYSVSKCGWVLGQTTHDSQDSSGLMSDRYRVIQSLLRHCEADLTDTCIPDVWNETCVKVLESRPDLWEDFDLVFADVVKHFTENHAELPDGVTSTEVYGNIPTAAIDVSGYKLGDSTTYKRLDGTSGDTTMGDGTGGSGAVGAFVNEENGTMNGGVKTCPVHNGVVLKNGSCAICGRGEAYNLQLGELQYRPGTDVNLNLENASVDTPQGVANSELTAAIEQNSRTAFWATVAATMFYWVGEMLILLSMVYTTLYIMSRGVAWFPKNWLRVLSLGFMDAYMTSAKSFVGRSLVLIVMGILLVTGWAFTWVTYFISWLAMLLHLV